MTEAIEPSAYAFVEGVRATRGALARWNRRPLATLAPWVAGSGAIAVLMLLGVWLVASLRSGAGWITLGGPPFRVGGLSDVGEILGHNLLVLALHAMACVAGFIAGSSLPLQAEGKRGLSRAVHAHAGRLAIAFVIGATSFSLVAQTLSLGQAAAIAAHALHVAPGALLLALVPHALPELIALFLPLAAWILASRRGDWDDLLAATFVTVMVAVPVLVITAVMEVYLAPALVGALH